MQERAQRCGVRAASRPGGAAGVFGLSCRWHPDGVPVPRRSGTARLDDIPPKVGGGIRSIQFTSSLCRAPTVYTPDGPRMTRTRKAQEGPTKGGKSLGFQRERWPATAAPSAARQFVASS